MRQSEIGDPRIQELFGPEAAEAAGVKPVVRLPSSGPSGWLIAVFVIGGALLLFWMLESRRDAQPEPQVRVRGPQATFSPEPPPLYIPPAPPPQPDLQPSQESPPEAAPASETQSRLMPTPSPKVVYEQPVPQRAPAVPRAPQASSGPALVIDTTGSTAPQPGRAAMPSGAAGGSSQWGGRARASTLANRSSTVPQGAMIPAVLETGFDSTSAGLARAIVSRDVRGFDGKKVLIPRGSRLIGEYQSDVAFGQNRALITWTRLLRPDGVTISLDSPATDTLGRGGVKASVNSHFWTRLGDAVLGSAASIGTALGTRAATGTVIVSVPGSVQQSASQTQAARVVPTLTMKPGTSISVFVARDLEFPDGGKAE